MCSVLCNAVNKECVCAAISQRYCFQADMQMSAFNCMSTVFAVVHILILACANAMPRGVESQHVDVMISSFADLIIAGS